MLAQRWGGSFRRSVREKAAAKGDEAQAFRSTRISLTPDDFGTVLVQLRALGLIQKSERKRSISDKGSYWTLTPYGDTHLTTLRALRKTREPMSESTDEPAEEE